MTPFPFRIRVPSFLAAVCGLLASGAAAADPIYTMLEVPVALPTAASINNKSQVATTRVVGTGVMLDLWLPAADYGLEAGVHSYSVPFNLPGLISATTSISVKRFADNGTVYLTDGSYAELTFHNGVFAALIGFVANRSDLFNGMNMSANGIIYAKPWDPSTGSPGSDFASGYLKTGPGHPRQEYHGPPNAHLRFGNSHGVQIAGAGTTVGTWNGAFAQLALPGGGSFFDINDKGQLLSNNGYFYLPAADYGRGGGFHAFSFTPNNAPVSTISGHGEIYGVSGHPANQFFSIEHDKVINLNEALAPGSAATITHTYWINDNGVILARGTLNGTPNKVLLLNPLGPAISATLAVDPARVELDDTLELMVTIRNDSALPFVSAGVRGETFLTIGTGELEQLTIPPPITALLPGESRTQTFSWKATGLGELVFSLQVRGEDSEGTVHLSDTITSETVTIASLGDLLIKKASQSDAFYGEDDVYQDLPRGQQRETIAVATGQVATFNIKVQNDNAIAATFALQVVEDPDDQWETAYTLGGVDIKAALLSAEGYSTGELAANAAVVIRAAYTPVSAEIGGEKARAVSVG